MSNERTGIDGIDKILEWIDDCDRAEIAHQKRLIMRLNKAEILCLAKHYKIKDTRFYTAPGDWKFGGKEELAGEIAERMLA